MKFVLKATVLLVVAVLALTVLTLTVLRFQPGWVVGVLNSVQNAAKLDATEIQVRYLPPSVQAARIGVVTAAQNIELQALQVAANPDAWWSDAPFWEVAIEQARVAQLTNATAPVAQEAPGSIGVLNLMPYLTFSQVSVGELTLSLIHI